ncbi:MAG: mandelate racemase/muconate lactonizing enzyme family protein [Halobacteriaceae archaeon]
MNVRRVTVHQFDVPLEEPFVTALRPVPELERVLVEVETESGLVGVGEAAPGPQVTGETQEGIAAAIEKYLGPAALESDPIDIERWVADLDRVLGEAPTAKAALETAAQDLRGKRADLPLYRLLGGHADDPAIEAPAVLSLDDPEAMADAAAAAVEAGYRQLKVKLGGDPATDAERVRAIDGAVPASVSMKADANQAWPDAKVALAALRPVADRLDVIEQPVAESAIEDLALLRERLDIPVMPDESLWDAEDAVHLIEHSAGDMYNIKLMKTGGITGGARLNAVCDAKGYRTQVGSMVEGHVGTAAGVHFALAFENVVYNEMVGPFMTTTGITDLEFDLPDIRVGGPGLGVEVDRGTLEELTADRSVIA